MKRKIPKMTPEEIARRAETTRMVDERIAYHSAMAAKERLERERRAALPSWRRRLFPWRLRVERLT